MCSLCHSHTSVGYGFRYRRDERIVLHAMYAVNNGSVGIVLLSSDTDVFVLGLFFLGNVDNPYNVVIGDSLVHLD